MELDNQQGQESQVDLQSLLLSSSSTLESKWLHLVAVFSDGRRMYLSTSPSSGCLTGFNTNHHKPSCLKVVTTRPAPPWGVSGGLSFGAMALAGRPQNEDLSLKVDAAYYSAGTLILSDASPSTMPSLLVLNRDSSTQSSPLGYLGTSTRSSRALRESVSSLPVEGRMLSVADVLPLPDTAATVQSLYSEIEFGGYESSMELCEGSLANSGQAGISQPNIYFQEGGLSFSAPWARWKLFLTDHWIF